MSANAYSYTITQNSVIVIVDGKPYTVAKGSPNFLALRSSLVNERWDDVRKHLTIPTSIERWAKGRFSVCGDVIMYDGYSLPKELCERIVKMAANGESPEPMFKFWEKLQKNPSMRSVEQLYPFMNHVGIPITKDGNFRAYKAVRSDYKDIHTGTIDNHPGETPTYDRNKVSDDPNTPCHEGLHVGALEYAQSFGGPDSIIIICEVDPADVVCIPYDSSHQKMRVCKYKVIGNHNGEYMSSTSTGSRPRDIYKDIDDPYEEYETDYDECSGYYSGCDCAECTSQDGGYEEECDECGDDAPCTCDDPFAGFDDMNASELMNQPTKDLRTYASRKLNIVGASRIPGGKTPLVARIIKVRKQLKK